MPRVEILWPIGAMALLTFLVLGLMPIRRIAAVSKKEITPEDFRYGESAQVSGYVSIPNRAMMNLLELPVLFYVVCVMFYVTDSIERSILYLAWLYVGLRFAHTTIHLSYNNVVHRLIAFAASNVVLIALWAIFFVNIASRQATPSSQ